MSVVQFQEVFPLSKDQRHSPKAKGIHTAEQDTSTDRLQSQNLYYLV
jgi:hypothetical protein